jgi:hypothetical protein
MKTVSVKRFWLVPAAGTAALLFLLLSGCLEKHLVWSPDGNRAAVIAKDGLHFCDAEGRLTPLLLLGVYQAAWFSDSQRLVVARERKVGDWTSLARTLGPERVAKVAAEAEPLWKQLETGGKWGILTMELGKKKDQAVLKIFLRERYGDTLRAKMSASEWDELQTQQAEISELVMARIVGEQIQPGTLLHEGLERINDLRVAPGDRAVAFTTDMALDNDKECRLLLALIDATGAVTIAEHTGTYPDWTADGRSLAFVQALGGAKDDLRLGTLVRREVLDENSQIKIAEKPEELAGLLFGNGSRVRCLQDGRILFNSAEFTLPVAAKDAKVERDELFAWDPARQATLVRMVPHGEEENLPKNLTFFEVSPDQKQVLVGGYDGEVSVLTLATGDVQEWQKAGDYNLMGAPVWRNAEEITYARRNPTAEGKMPARKAEIVLRKAIPGKGDQEKVLSRDWSSEMLESIYSGADRNSKGP